MTTSLRKEYNKKVETDKDLLDEASFAWVKDNVFLINEDLNIKLVNDFIGRFEKFDSTFGRFKEKLPTIARQIDDVERDLNQVITSEINDKKATVMLKKMANTYSHFSRFFRRSLPSLLAAPMFRAAKEHPDVKLNVLQAPGHDILTIRKAFRKAARPGLDRLRKKLSSKKELPVVDAGAIATEMLNLSLSELKELTGVADIPMVETPEISAAGPQAAPVGESVGLGEMVFPKKKDLNEATTLLEVISNEDARQLIQTMNQINRLMNVKGLEDINASLTRLSGEAYDEFNKGTWLDKKLGVKFKQLLSFDSVLSALKNKWTDVKPFFNDKTLDEEELNRIRETLQGAAKESEGYISKIKSFFTGSSPHAPGLEPNVIIDGIMNALSQIDANGNNAGLEPIEKLFNSLKSIKSPEELQGDSGDVTQASPESKASDLLTALQQKGFTSKGQGDQAVEELINLMTASGFRI